MKDWNEFYRLADGRYGEPDELTDLIIRRLAPEVGFSESQGETLRKLLWTEHVETTQEAITKYGRAENIRILLETPGMREGVWEEVVTLREGVRRRHDSEFVDAFDASQWAAINEHLRNKSLVLVQGSTRTRRNLFLFCGVGKEP